ncbi:MAG: hypothetical protein CMA62_05295 [Euryarchaeota archaeon]|jgi:hypothetical protein|nr:hypothetical protein [Euryarchaeota archaeon]MBT86910.1 hypothetical protein [Euryarchaeota archaeon]DAC48165.1 MAG TPA: hypothetical protein D7H82_00310 [Candidatus Poseidoniales archaeon]HII33321.1 hypothetical protein [Candidatus Thalassarchaeaceae archaeon]|tara:strand:- start:79 stop:375 length:297 start_codon:yes stop_codon:yes gene_type:complete
MLDYLLAPRRDHRGWKTPSEASRILLVVVVLGVSYWAWPVTEGNIVMWVGTVIMVSTALLTVGWWILSLAARGREPRILTTSVGKIQNKGRGKIRLDD